MSAGDSSGADETGKPSSVFLSVVVAAAVVNTVCLVGLADAVPDVVAFVGIVAWVGSFLAIPVAGYLDLRRVRNAGYWDPRASGALWVVGFFLPIVSPSVVVAYVLRRREVVTFDGFWGRWHLVTAATMALLFVWIVIVGVSNDPSASENTAIQNVVVSQFLVFMLLPGLTTLFDLAYIRRTWGQRLKTYHWLWVPGMLVWFVQFLVVGGYLVWRYRFLDGTDDFETIESTLDDAGSHLDSGADALEADQYDPALSSYDRAERAIDEASDAIDRMAGPNSTRPPRLEETTATLADLRSSVYAGRVRAAAANTVTRGEDALESGDFGAAIEAFETAIERGDDALGRIDDEGDAAAVRSWVNRARDGRETARQRLASEELDPLADRIEAVYAAGTDALEAGEYDDATDCFEDAADLVDEFRTLVDTYAFDRDPPVEGDELDEKLATVERRRVVADEVDPLADRIESAYTEGVEALESGEYETAIQRFETAERTVSPFEAVCDENDVDADPPVAPDEVADRIATAKRERTRAEVEAGLDRASDARSEGKAAMDEGEYDRAVEAFDRAREELDAAQDLADEVGIDEWDVDERRSTIDGLHGSAVAQARERRYSDPLERGDECREDAAEAAEAGDYADAVVACEAARSAYEDALGVAEENDVGDPSEVQARIDEIDDLHSDYLIRELSGRVTDARVPVDEGDREQSLAAAEDLASLVADLEDRDIDRERDLAVLREEAERERIKALLLAERERALAAVEAFRNGEYATARDEFEAARAAVAEVRADAEAAEITEYDGAIEQLESACERNADAARRGALGIVDEPSMTAIDVTVAGDRMETAARKEPAIGAEAGQSAAGESETARRPAPNGGAGQGSPDEAVQDELPAHEELGHVGSGGNADVYEVRLESGEHAALKVPRWQGTLSKTLLEEFASEAETWSKLDDHDDIVSVLGWGENPYPWLLLEYLPASLAAEMDALGLAESIDVLVGVADALEFAHGRGVVHLDVKPENVLLTDAGDPKVGDWGLSQVVLDHTRTRMGLTPPYSAPEQLSDRHGDIDRRTDVYQLSVLAYRVLTGRLPFDADRPADLQRQILEAEPTPLSAVNPALDPAVDEAVLRGLAKSPADRYDAAVLLRNELSKLASD